MPGFDMRAGLERIAVPALLLAGEKDRNAPAAAMERMAKKVPGAQFQVLAGVGHLAHLERPDRFNDVIGEFLATIG